VKKESRKPQVSIRGETYAKVKAYVERLKKGNPDLEHLAIAGFIENLCTGFFARGEKNSHASRARAAKKAPSKGNGAAHHEDLDVRSFRF
jgi:hypothetical protein